MNGRASLIPFVVGVALVAAALDWIGGWALPTVIGALVLMVVGHEFGHFITAKRAGLVVTDFFVGFGPVIWSTTVGETRYGVRLLPLGGYVKIPGMTWADELPAELEPRTYRAASYPRQVLFAGAGSLMHGVMALVLAWASLSLVGLPSPSHVAIGSFTPWDGHARNAAQLAGLHVGDRIVSVDGQAVRSAQTLVTLVHDHIGRPLRLVVERGSSTRTIVATPVNGQRLKVGGQRLDTGSRPEGFIGVTLVDQVVRQSWLASIPGAFSRVGEVAALSVHGLVHVFSPGEFVSLYHQITNASVANRPSVQLSRPQSIVGVVRLAVQSAALGPGVLLEVLMAVNIFVGLMNLLPLLPLDGGYIAVATYERIRSRRGRRYHADLARLNPVVFAFVAVLLALFASTLYLDIVHPIANPF